MQSLVHPSHEDPEHCWQGLEVQVGSGSGTGVVPLPGTGSVGSIGSVAGGEPPPEHPGATITGQNGAVAPSCGWGAALGGPRVPSSPPLYAEIAHSKFYVPGNKKETSTQAVPSLAPADLNWLPAWFMLRL